MSAATKSRPKPSVNGHRRPLPVAPAPVPPPAQTSTLPANSGRYEPAVPIDRIVASSSNPRKTFDADYISELAASIREVGLIEPILLRPRLSFVVREKKRGLGSSTWRVEPRAGRDGIFPEFGSKESAEASCREANAETVDAGEASFELVVGECRWRAHKEAGLTTIAATIRELSDKQVAEIQLVENLQRKGVDPIEEAEGFQRLLDEHGYTADTLAAKVGKSKAYIYSILKILAAPKGLLDLVRKGETSASVAQLFGRIPNERMRAEAFKNLFCRGFGNREVTFRDAKDYLERSCMIELKGSPFDQKDAELTSAGACTVCPHRTGNSPDLYPGARADVCANPTCYQEKVLAHGRKQIEAAKAGGATVLDKSAKLFTNYGTLEYSSSYVDLDDECHDAKKSGKWRTLLGKDAKESVVLATDPKGQVHELIPKTKAQRILRDKGFGRSTSGSGGQRGSIISPAETLNQKVNAALVLRLMERSVKAAKEAVRGAASLGAEGPSFLRALVTLIGDGLWHELRRKILKRRNYNGELKHLVNELPQDELLAVLVEAMVCKHLDKSLGGYSLGSSDISNAFKDLLEFLSLDRAAIEKEVRAELQAKAAAKNGKPAKAKKGARS